MPYMMASIRYLVDLETYKLVHFTSSLEPDLVHIPLYFLRYSDHVSLRRIFQAASGENTVKLNKIEVEFFQIGEKTANFGFDRHIVSLKFFDRIRGTDIGMDIQISPYFGGLATARPSATEVRAIGYDVEMDGKVERFRTDFSPMDSGIFQSMDTLARANTYYPSVKDKFYYGLSHHHYRVQYRNKKLHGSCFALLCGTWAILLDDDLSLDAIVLLKGASQELLIVDRFIYVASRYIIKFLTLMG